MGSACRVLRKITMTHGIQPKISVCLSVIRKPQLKSCAQRSGAFNLSYFEVPVLLFKKMGFKVNEKRPTFGKFWEKCPTFGLSHNH